MANKRSKPEEIARKLRQVGVLMGQGLSRLDAIRRIGVVEQTYYSWRKQHGGTDVDQQKELKRLKQENEGHRRAISERSCGYSGLKSWCGLGIWATKNLRFTGGCGKCMTSDYEGRIGKLFRTYKDNHSTLPCHSNLALCAQLTLTRAAN